MNQLSDDLKKSIIDFFEPEELVSLLDLSQEEYEELVECLEDKILDNAKEIKEQMRYDDEKLS